MIQFESPNIAAPPSAIVGVIAEEGTTLAAVSSTGATYLKYGDPLPEKPGDYILEHTLAMSDAIAKARALAQLLELRAQGATIVLISADEQLLECCADEIWWVRHGRLIARGDPAEVLREVPCACG